MGENPIPVNANLTQKALHALKWRYTGTALQVLLQFIVGIVLARLLSPEEFGIVGLALIVVGFGRLIVDMGFGAAIIQYPSMTRNHVHAAFTGSVTISTLLFCVLYFFAPAVSNIFLQDELTPILRMTGLSFVFQGMSAAPISLLRRELRFRTLAGLETVSYTIGYGLVGISLAALGYGVWSLVSACIVQPFCLAILAIRSTSLTVRPFFGIREYRDLKRVAFAEVLNNLTNYVADNLSFFFIGRYLGASALGLYRRASDLMRLPLWHSSVALRSVMFPVYSTIQGDIPRLRRAHLHTVSLTAVVTMPPLFAIAAAPEIVIGGLFGEQWKAASGVLQLLCIAGPFMAVIQVLGALSHARGYVFSEWGRQIIYLVSMGIALLFLLPFGIRGAALAVVLATLARYFALVQLSVRLVMCSWKDFLLAHSPGLLLGIAVSSSVHFGVNLIAMMAIPEPLQLLMIAILAMFSLVLSLLLFPASWLRNLYPWVIDQFSGSLPPLVYKIITSKLSKAQIDEGDEATRAI